MPTDPLARLSMRMNFRVIVVPRPGDGSCTYCVGAASGPRVSTGVSGSGVSGSGVSGRGGSGVGGRGRVLRSGLVTESEDHDERLMCLCLCLGGCWLRVGNVSSRPRPIEWVKK